MNIQMKMTPYLASLGGWVSEPRSEEGAEPEVETFLFASTRWQQGLPFVSLPIVSAFTPRKPRPWTTRFSRISIERAC